MNAATRSPEAPHPATRRPICVSRRGSRRRTRRRKYSAGLLRIHCHAASQPRQITADWLTNDHADRCKNFRSDIARSSSDEVDGPGDSDL